MEVVQYCYVGVPLLSLIVFIPFCFEYLISSRPVIMPCSVSKNILAAVLCVKSDSQNDVQMVQMIPDGDN
jgi:hypothetical protein